MSTLSHDETDNAIKKVNVANLLSPDDILKENRAIQILKVGTTGFLVVSQLCEKRNSPRHQIPVEQLRRVFSRKYGTCSLNELGKRKRCHADFHISAGKVCGEFSGK